MFNLKRCKKCKYHGGISSDICCDYSRTGTTALKKVGNKVIDMRGEDPDNCKLYVKGRTNKMKERIKKDYERSQAKYNNRVKRPVV